MTYRIPHTSSESNGDGEEGWVLPGRVYKSMSDKVDSQNNPFRWQFPLFAAPERSPSILSMAQRPVYSIILVDVTGKWSVCRPLMLRSSWLWPLLTETPCTYLIDFTRIQSYVSRVYTQLAVFIEFLPQFMNKLPLNLHRYFVSYLCLMESRFYPNCTCKFGGALLENFT